MKIVRCLLACLFIIISAHADRLTIHNRTPRDLYMAVYYAPTSLPFSDEPQVEIASPIQFIEADSSGIIERPGSKILTDRELVFVEDKALLKQKLSKKDLERFHSKNVGYLQGDVFYIGDKDGEFKGYTTLQWNVEEVELQRLRRRFMEMVPQIVDNPYKSTVAHVRVGNEIAQAERTFLEQRIPRVRSALEKLVGRPLSDKILPNISFVCSGGGYRAMLFTVGALLGADKIGLLDATTYMVGLSGSTWAIGGWMLSDKSLDAYHEWLVRNVRFGLKNVTSDDMQLIGYNLMTKYFYDEPYDIVDIYGSLLANELFAEKGNKKQRQTLSSQAQRIKGGALPFPIYTAIGAESLAAENLWYEFTPYEVGGSWLGMYVPSWAFGRKFKNGTSVTFAPEQNFGVLMATFGLAIGVTIDRIIKEIDLKNKLPLGIMRNILDRILMEHAEKRITSSDFCNFTLGMNSSLQGHDMKLVDAGINFNLPYPPISGQRAGRKADIIIFVDASGGDDLSADLRQAEAYARRHGLKFPSIDYTNVGKRAFNIFKNDKDPSVPVIVYIPRIVEQPLIDKAQDPVAVNVKPYLTSFDVTRCIKSGPCNTFNFEYSEKDARTLTALGTFNVVAAKQSLVDVINWVIDRKNPAPAKR